MNITPNDILSNTTTLASQTPLHCYVQVAAAPLVPCCSCPWMASSVHDCLPTQSPHLAHLPSYFERASQLEKTLPCVSHILRSCHDRIKHLCFPSSTLFLLSRSRAMHCNGQTVPLAATDSHFASLCAFKAERHQRLVEKS